MFSASREGGAKYFYLKIEDGIVVSYEMDSARSNNNNTHKFQQMTIKKEIPFVLQFEQDLLIEDGLYPRNSRRSLQHK